MHQFLLTPYFLEKEKPELNSIQEKDWLVNYPVVTGATVSERIKEVHHVIEHSVNSILQKQQLPVSMGGDCCMTIPIMAALQKNGISPWMLWLDAHGDFNTDTTTVTGFLGGMPLAMLSGRGDQQLIQNAGVKTVKDEDIVLSDARDLDPAEEELIESSDIYRLENISYIKEFDFGNRPLFIHFDTDLVHAHDLPALLYPVASGPRIGEVAELFKHLQRTQHICAISVTCWEPSLDKDGLTGKSCKELVSLLLP